MWSENAFTASSLATFPARAPPMPSHTTSNARSSPRLSVSYGCPDSAVADFAGVGQCPGSAYTILRWLAASHLSAELPARGVDVAAERAPHRRRDAVLLQYLLKTRASSPCVDVRSRRLLHTVERDEIDVRRRYPAISLPEARAMRLACRSRRRSSRIQTTSAARSFQNTSRQAARQRVHAASGRLTGMIWLRDSSSGAWSDTDSVSCNFRSASLSDLVDQPAGGKADVPHPDVQSLSGCSPAPETASRCRSCPVARRCPSERYCEIGSPDSIWVKMHLIQHLRRREPPHKPAHAWTRRTCTAHRAADLGGDADGVAVMIAASAPSPRSCRRASRQRYLIVPSFCETLLCAPRSATVMV